MEAETCPKPLIEAPLSSTSSCSSSSSSEVKPTSPSSRKRSRSSLEGTQKGAESTSKEETEGAVCGICFEQPGKVKGKLDSCVHTFCFDCIHRWSKIKNTCPYCNARFSHIIKEREPTGRNGRHRKKQVRVRRTDPSFSDDELPFGGFGMNDPLNFFGLISLMLRGRATAVSIYQRERQTECSAYSEFHWTAANGTQPPGSTSQHYPIWLPTAR